MILKNLYNNKVGHVINFNSLIHKENLQQDDNLLIFSEENFNKVKYGDFFKVDVSIIPNRNQIVYLTIDKEPIVVEHSLLESNRINHQGIGILTFTSNNFESISLSNNENLLACVLPNGMTKLSGKTFQNCINLKFVLLPDTIESFSANDTFDNCQSLTSLTLPKNLKSTGGYTFRNCMSLEQMYLPDTLTNQPMMTGLKNLRFIKFPTNSSFTKVSGLSNCTSLEKVYLPSNIDTIESSTFSGCVNLRDINLDKIKYIGAGAFNNCSSLREITIPSTQELLGQDIVSRCKLDRLIIKATQPQFHQFTFSGTTVKYLDYYGEYLPSECDLPISEAETIILRNTKGVLTTQDGQYTLDKPYQSSKIYSWLKIYVPNSLVDSYKESYPKLKNNFYPIYSE